MYFLSYIHLRLLICFWFHNEIQTHDFCFVTCKSIWIQCVLVKYGQEACMFLCTNVYEMPCTAVFCSKVHIIFKVSLRLHVQKWPRSLLCCVLCFAFITLLHVFSRHIQSTSTFTRAKVAKKPALLCKMFSSFVGIGILHVLS